MKKLYLAGVSLASVVAVGVAFAASAPAHSSAADGPPPWAWGFTTDAPPGPPTEFTPQAPGGAVKAGEPKHNVPGSKFSFSKSEASARYAPVDWFPEDHPPMPDIVAHGREAANPPVYACALCHMPNGKGRPENAAVSGLPYDYIMRQLQDFKAGHRRSSDPRKTNTAVMESFTRSMTEDEMKQAAAYFSAIPATPWIKVVEAATVPKTRFAGGVFFALEGKDAGTEALGNRILETPVNNDDFEMWRNPHSGFVAYVPPGSVAKGKALVTAGSGKTTPCTVCHGVDLRGLGPVPRLANRSPSYIVRQIYDMQHGNRLGEWMPLMAPVIEKLTRDDVLNIAAYLASLEP